MADTRRRRAWFASLLLLGASTASAEVYRWTDADGRVHFSDQAPQDARAAVQEIALPEVPSRPDPEMQRERERGRKLLEVWSAERRARVDAAQESGATAEQRERSCARLRAHLAELQSARLVIRPDGMALDVNQRIAYEQELREMLEAHCS